MSSKPSLWKRVSKGFQSNKSQPRGPRGSNNPHYATEYDYNHSSSYYQNDQAENRGENIARRGREKLKKLGKSIKSNVNKLRSRSAAPRREKGTNDSGGHGNDRGRAEENYGATDEAQEEMYSYSNDSGSGRNKGERNGALGGVAKAGNKIVENVRNVAAGLSKMGSSVNLTNRRGFGGNGARKKRRGKSENIIVAGENDHFEKEQYDESYRGGGAKESYYPDALGVEGATPGLYGLGSIGTMNYNASNVWISHVDKTTGKLAFKNVQSGTKMWNKPFGKDVIILDSRTLESSLNLGRTRLGQSSSKESRFATQEGFSNSSASPSNSVQARSPRAGKSRRAFRKDEALEKFMKELDMTDKLEALYSQGITFDSLKFLKEENLNELEFNIGERIKFTNAVMEKFKTNSQSSHNGSILERQSLLRGDFHDQSFNEVELASMSSDSDEEIIYHLRRTQSRGRLERYGSNASNVSATQSIDPEEGEELVGVKGSTNAAATITALTNLVEKILNNRNESSSSIVPYSKIEGGEEKGSDTQADIFENEYERDRRRQEEIRAEEQSRKRRLQSLFRRESGSMAGEEKNQESREPNTAIVFDLADTAEVATAHPSIMFDLADEEPPSLQLVVSDAVNFDFLLEDTQEADFGFLVEDDSPMGTDLVPYQAIPDFTDIIATEDELETFSDVFNDVDELQQLEQDILDAEAALSAKIGFHNIKNSQKAGAEDYVEIEEAVDAGAILSTRSAFQPVRELPEAEGDHMPSTQLDNADNSPSDTVEGTTGSEKDPIESISRAYPSSEHRRKHFLESLKARSTDSGFESLVSNEAKTRNISLSKTESSYSGKETIDAKPEVYEVLHELVSKIELYTSLAVETPA